MRIVCKYYFLARLGLVSRLVLLSRRYCNAVTPQSPGGFIPSFFLQLFHYRTLALMKPRSISARHPQILITCSRFTTSTRKFRFLSVYICRSIVYSSIITTLTASSPISWEQVSLDMSRVAPTGIYRKNQSPISSGKYHWIRKDKVS